MPGPVCYAIYSVNPNRWLVNEIIDNLGIDFFKNQGSDCSSVTNNGTNPVNIGTGNKLQHELDYESNPLVFKRTYNNTSRPLGLGSGWRGSFDRFIKNDAQYSPNSAYMYRENGAVFRFNLIVGNWKTDADISDRLIELKDANNLRTGWRYIVAADDTVETYSATGKLLSIADHTGRLQTLNYTAPLASGGDDDPETLDTVTDDVGRFLRFAYDTSKRIATVTDPVGGLITYGYDAQSNLVSVQYPDGKTKTYHYNEPAHTSGANLPHALTGITDENGVRYATYQYAVGGETISTGHAAGADLHQLTYNPDGSTTVTDPLGAQRIHTFTTILGVVKSTGQSQPGGSGCGAASSATTYDANGNVASRADFNGHKTCYAYDLTRNLETARVEGLAAGASCPTNLVTYTPAANSAERKILTEWSTSFRLPTKVTEAGRETSTVYDSHGNVTSTSIKDTALNKTRSWSTAYTYHASVPGMLVQKVDNGPRTDVADLTTTDYYLPDENCLGGHAGCRGQVRQIANALGHVTQLTRYTAHGQPEEIVDPNGLVTTLTYDARQRLLTRTAGSETTGYDYDGVGQLIKLTQPDGSFVGYEYDPAHRLTRIADALGNQIVYTLDPAGNRIKEDMLDPAGTLAQTQRREYDTLNRLWKDIGAQGQTTAYQYDAQGNRKQVSDPLNHATASQYDALDRLILTVDPAGGQTVQTPDALDRLASVTDPKGVATATTYNAFGEVVREVSPDRGTIDYTYNDAGALVSSKRSGEFFTLYYTRDALNRLTGISSSTSDILKIEASLFYDEGSSGRGRLTSVNSYGGGYQRYRYDAHGRLLHMEEGLSGQLALDRVYDPAGRPLQATYPSGTVISAAYGLDGRPVELRVNGAVLLSDIVYHPFGAPKAWTWSNGTAYTRSFDADGRTSQYLLGTDTRLITYDDASRITHTGHANPGLNRDYGYDVLDHIIHETDSVGPSRWTYDPNGNRTSSQPGTASYAYAYPSTSNRLTSVAGPNPKTYTYNAAGNMVGDGVYTYNYDKFGRLASVWHGSVRKASYSVNGLGQRTSKTVGGVTTLFFYDEAGRLLGEYDGTRALIQETVWLDDLPIAVLKKNPSTGQTEVYRIHADHINTPRAILDSADRIVWKWHSNAFGQGQPEEDPDGDGKTFVYNLRFPGQYFDRETGLHYNYFRDYDSTTGRYIEADPIGLNGGMNVYAYVDGNPIGYVDPLGLWSIGFEGYAGLGGGITFGRDSNTGQSFITLRGGYGVGGGFDYDPLATRPGSEECTSGQESNPSGEALGIFGKAGGRLGPLKAGLGANTGLQNGASAWPVNSYGSFAKPKASLTNRGTGINASAAAGVEFTIYGKGRCGCSN
ncbi:MAG: RHS repeat-associated core domain-containing protein [Thiobacillus sp.]|nr:RHS repeat-associated core domain-containing protein [Thiobacillus sp.]